MIVVSGFFQNEQSAEEALFNLLATGVPRDLLEVAINKTDERRFFLGVKKRKLSPSTTHIGKGALIGLIGFTYISAMLIVASYAHTSHHLIWIMLLGPNMGLLVGGLLGYLWGIFRPRPIPAWAERLCENKGLLLIAKAKSLEEAQNFKEKLSDASADSVRIEKL